jgi:hypothetical protein
VPSLRCLFVLARHPGRVLSRDQLLDAALGRRAEPYDRSVDVLVGRLRRKIEPDPKVPRLIGSGGRSGAIGSHPTAGHSRQWNGGGCVLHWGQNGFPFGWAPYGRQGVPTYWVWGPSGGAFDYPFADWRGPTGGWGNP